MRHGLTMCLDIVLEPCPSLECPLCLAVMVELISVKNDFGSNLIVSSKQARNKGADGQGERRDSRIERADF